MWAFGHCFLCVDEGEVEEVNISWVSLRLLGVHTFRGWLAAVWWAVAERGDLFLRATLHFSFRLLS
jgi:hypothetical protein